MPGLLWHPGKIMIKDQIIQIGEFGKTVAKLFIELIYTIATLPYYKFTGKTQPYLFKTTKELIK